MQSVLVFAKGMYDAEGNLPADSLICLDKALMFAEAHPNTMIFTAASLPPGWPADATPLSVAMERYLKEQGATQTRVLTEPCRFNTRGELRKFLAVAEGRLVLVSGGYHLPRIFCYVWEEKGWRFARQATYFSAGDASPWHAWLVELIKIGVIALPQPVQHWLEEWYARRTHTYQKS